MIDVMENIKKLSAALDAETASLHPSGQAASAWFSG